MLIGVSGAGGWGSTGAAVMIDAVGAPAGSWAMSEMRSKLCEAHAEGALSAVVLQGREVRPNHQPCPQLCEGGSCSGSQVGSLWQQVPQVDVSQWQGCSPCAVAGVACFLSLLTRAGPVTSDLTLRGRPYGGSCRSHRRVCVSGALTTQRICPTRLMCARV